jgi:hypothetical protein
MAPATFLLNSSFLCKERERLSHPVMLKSSVLQEKIDSIKLSIISLGKPALHSVVRSKPFSVSIFTNGPRMIFCSGCRIFSHISMFSSLGDILMIERFWLAKRLVYEDIRKFPYLYDHVGEHES